MKYCLSCGLGCESGFHISCIRKLFGVNYLPKINFTLKEIAINAQKMAGKLSISGVQPKLSMRLDRKSKELVKFKIK